MAVGGYGRGELAPCSDIDLLFLHALQADAHVEQMIEFMLYRLWDLGLKVGQATRTVEECMQASRGTISPSAPRCSRRAPLGRRDALR